MAPVVLAQSQHPARGAPCQRSHTLQHLSQRRRRQRQLDQATGEALGLDIGGDGNQYSAAAEFCSCCCPKMANSRCLRHNHCQISLRAVSAAPCGSRELLKDNPICTETLALTPPPISLSPPSFDVCRQQASAAIAREQVTYNIARSMSSVSLNTHPDRSC